MEWRAGLGTAMLGKVRSVAARTGSAGMERKGTARLGPARRGWNWFGRNRRVPRDTAVFRYVWHGRLGSAGFGYARVGVVWRAMLVLARQDRERSGAVTLGAAGEALSDVAPWLLVVCGRLWNGRHRVAGFCPA